jgi:H+/Cl- antiporter ClcA
MTELVQVIAAAFYCTVGPALIFLNKHLLSTGSARRGNVSTRLQQRSLLWVLAVGVVTHLVVSCAVLFSPLVCTCLRAILVSSKLSKSSSQTVKTESNGIRAKV